MTIKTRKITAIIMRMSQRVSFQVHTPSLSLGSTSSAAILFTFGQKKNNEVIALTPVTIARAVYNPLIRGILLSPHFNRSHKGNSCSSFSTIRFCSASGGRGNKYCTILTIVNVATVVPLELLRICLKNISDSMMS